eukprot:13379636-Alexandrium_andersonii.AAC.1
MSRPALRVEELAAKLVGLATGATSTVVASASQGLGVGRNCGLAMPGGAAHMGVQRAGTIIAQTHEMDKLPAPAGRGTFG